MNITSVKEDEINKNNKDAKTIDQIPISFKKIVIKGKEMSAKSIITNNTIIVFRCSYRIKLNCSAEYKILVSEMNKLKNDPEYILKYVLIKEHTCEVDTNKSISKQDFLSNEEIDGKIRSIIESTYHLTYNDVIKLIKNENFCISDNSIRNRISKIRSEKYSRDEEFMNELSKMVYINYYPLLKINFFLILSAELDFKKLN